MEIFISTICLLILAETTILTLKSTHKPLLNSNPKRKIYVDTSALMDQRLLPVMKTGFISDDMLIPRSVIHELQMLADGKDRDKRLRARAGLDVVRDLERIIHFNLEIIDDALDHTPVDDRLLELARTNRGIIMTNDFNLKKVAATEHIEVLSLNELALALKNDYASGEHTTVRIVAVGSGQDQGVGYLKDGTMVVVDRASQLVGQEAEIELQRTNQTAAGTMVFAKVLPDRSEKTSRGAKKVTNLAKRTLAKTKNRKK